MKKKCRKAIRLIGFRRCASGGASLVLLFCAVVLSVVMSGALSTPASATASTITLNVSTDSTSVNLIANSANGSFAKSGNTNISVATDNVTGYTLGIKASDSTYNNLVNSNSEACNENSTSGNSATGKVSSNCFTSINAATPEATFKALAGTSYNNLWGYLPSKYNSADNTEFLPAPNNTAGDTLDVTSTANAVANNYSIAVGARVDSSVKMGSYSNTFVILATANAVPYSITYDDSVISNMPTDESGSTMNNAVSVSSNIPVRSGYSFLGWCTVAVPDTVANTTACTSAGGTVYATSASVPTTSATNDYSLYAMWTEDLGQCSSKSNCMQFMNKYTLSTLMPTVGSSTTLYDMRDGQAYTVALLADGKYWMTKNLNLAGGTTLHSYDTDMPEGYTLPTANNFQANNTLPASATAGFNSNTGAFVYNSGNAGNADATETATCASDQPCYSYYSWTAATLGSGLSISTENTDAPYSICPKGWSLPTSGNSSNNEWKRGDFYQLATNYGVNLSSAHNENSATFYNNAGPGTTPNFLLAGYYRNGSFNYGGSRGGYWSSTSYGNSDDARSLLFNSGNVLSAYYGNRYGGFSVRCLFGE